MTKALESEKIAYAATQVDLTKVKKNFNPHDHLPENKEKLKEYERKKSESVSSEGKNDGKIEKEVMKELERVQENSKEEEPESEFLGFNDPEFLKWQKELAAAAAQQLQNSKKDVASTSKSQTSKC
ncbi:hypothetical protein QVD17_19605 [Tagetes erecta]|uniref:Uncharacterized protein n=1 Tax=Tagetes erecta TaxID=13708 RepID=A0AAD8KJR9_TARER|nr:hypothetical protein QVD17_19605 [Tagetes erecta]